MIRAVIFDFNGVLVDDESLHFDLFREVVAESGILLTEEMYHQRYLGFDDRRCFEEVLTDAGKAFDSNTIDEMIATKAARYIPRAEKGLRYFPGAERAIRELASRFPIAINSGALRPEIEYSLDRLDVRNCVKAVVSAEDATHCKPDPEGYLLALDALRSEFGEDLEAGHCLVFEDSLAGIQSAKGAGMWAVGVSNTYDESALRGAGADAVLPGLETLNPLWVEQVFTPEVSP